MTQKGLFQFKVMPFVLSNAPATFQKLMENVLMGLQWQNGLVYLDGIIVNGRDFDETLANMECVLERPKQADLKLKPSKCQWFQKLVKYLGHIVSKKGIECNPEKVTAVQHWPVPATVKEVRQFIGFAVAAYYHKFIPNFQTLPSHWPILPKRPSGSSGIKTVKGLFRPSRRIWSLPQYVSIQWGMRVILFWTLMLVILPWGLSFHIYNKGRRGWLHMPAKPCPESNKITVLSKRNF